MEKVILELNEMPDSCCFCELSYWYNPFDDNDVGCLKCFMDAPCPIHGRRNDCPLKAKAED
jgi:hypothetical protein